MNSNHCALALMLIFAAGPALADEDALPPVTPGPSMTLAEALDEVPVRGLEQEQGAPAVPGDLGVLQGRHATDRGRTPTTLGIGDRGAFGVFVGGMR